MKKKINLEGIIAIILGIGFFASCIIISVLSQDRINFNTYCAEGEILQKIDDDEYLILVDNGNYFSFYSDEEYTKNTKIFVCFDRGETDEVTDDKIIAISLNLFELQESLFTE